MQHTSFKLLFSKPGKEVQAYTVSGCSACHSHLNVFTDFHTHVILESNWLNKGHLSGLKNVRVECCWICCQHELVHLHPQFSSFALLVFTIRQTDHFFPEIFNFTLVTAYYPTVISFFYQPTSLCLYISAKAKWLRDWTPASTLTIDRCISWIIDA